MNQWSLRLIGSDTFKCLRFCASTWLFVDDISDISSLLVLKFCQSLVGIVKVNKHFMVAIAISVENSKI